MTKIMLVEDDRSLREIYGVRLLAEGYDIVSAGDGEEALAMAIKERPSLIITDVMMPRISGFDMLDILRSTTETKNIKVIMMTALSSEDQRKHGEQLGADRYLVKSQVGIEDVVRVVHEVLGDGKTPPPPPQPTPAANTPAAPTPPQTAPAAPPAPTPPTLPGTPPAAISPAPAMPPLPQPAGGLPKPAAPTTTAASAGPLAKQAPAMQPSVAAPAKPSIAPTQSTTPSSAGSRQRVIQPINDPTKKLDINNLLDKELAREAGVDINSFNAAPTTQAEKAAVQSQLRSLNPPSGPTVQTTYAQPSPPPVAPPHTPQQPVPITTPSPPLPTATPAAPSTPVTPPVRPPVQAPPRPNVAPVQPREGGVPPAPSV